MLRRCSNAFLSVAYFSCLNSSKESLILYSTSVASKDAIKTPLAVEFLVKSVGFSNKEATSIATKVSLSSITTRKPELVVDYLIETGFDGTQIRKIIACYPGVLRTNVDKTLKPKIRAFEDLGISGSELRQFISQNPTVLKSDVESSIAPFIGMLKSLLGSNAQLISFMLQIKTRPWFSSQMCKNLPTNILLLQSYGLTSERIKWLMRYCSFLFSGTQRAEEVLKRVEEKLGIPRTSDMFMYGIYASTGKSEENINSKLELLRCYGWSETHISTLLRNSPSVLCLSEENLMAKLKFYMKNHGLESVCLASNPVLLNYSMEKRILPRDAVRKTLMDGHLLKRQTRIITCMRMAESKFMERFVLPYKEKLPQLYENYTRAIGYTLSKI